MKKFVFFNFLLLFGFAKAATVATFTTIEEVFEALRTDYLLEKSKREQLEEEKEILEKTLKSYLERLFQKSPQQNLDVILLKENTKLREIIKTEREEAVRYNAALINQDAELIAAFHEISKTIDNVLNVQTETSLVDILIFIKEKISALGSVITFDEAAARIKKLEKENVALKLQLKAQDIEGPVRYPEQDALIKQLRDELEVVLKRAQEEVVTRQEGIERQRNASLAIELAEARRIRTEAIELVEARRLRTEAIENMQEAYSWKRLIKPVVTSFVFASAITYGCMKFWS